MKSSPLTLAAAGLLGAALMAPAVAALEARYPSNAVPEATWLPIWGLIAPLALILGVFGVIGWFVLDPGERWAWLRQRTDSLQVRWVLALSGIAVIFTMHAAARMTVILMSSRLPAMGVAGAMVLGTCLLAFTAVLTTDFIASILALRVTPPKLGVALALGVSAFLVGGGLSIALGETSGSGLWRIFGVLRRDELNLKPLGSLALLFLGALVGCAFAEGPIDRLRTLRSTLSALGLLSLLPLGITLVASRVAAQPARTIERSDGLARPLLVAARKLSDADGDGASGRFGGGDCAPEDPSIHPAADDVPGNGIDEDCSGRDAEKVELPKEEPKVPQSVDEWIEQQVPERPNVVLLTVDTLRADLGFLGYERDVSPRLDELAKKSAVFENAYALASYTSKSLAPMLIGKYPSETNRDWSHFDRFAKTDKFLPERLQAAGIRTVSVQGYWYFFFDSYGLERGFDVIDSSAAPKQVKIEGDDSVNGDKVADAAVAQLADPAMQKEQFYMWVHWVDPHSEYVAHEGIDFGEDERAAYDGEVAFVDRQIGKVLDALEKQGLSDRTIVVMTSDHGEAFGEHGRFRHGFDIWEELVRVPLLVHIPGQKAQRIEERRSILDITPTVLEIFGVDYRRVESEEDESLDFVRGHSLLADALGPPGHDPAERILFVDMPRAPNNQQRHGFYDGKYKLIISEGLVLGIYDLEADPGETKDLQEDKDLKQRLLDRYRAYFRALKVRNPRR